MFRLILYISLIALSKDLFSPLSAAVFYTIDTTAPLLCSFSSKYQNRIMVEEGRIQKVIAADEDRLSIVMEEISGQAFICARDCNPKETTVSIITENGLVQDIQVNFIERLPEVVILIDPTFQKKQEEKKEKFQETMAESHGHVLSKAEDLLSGRIPDGYVPCLVQRKRWRPKNGVVLEEMAQFEGPDEILCLYQVKNTLCRRNSLTEYELQHLACRWIFLETTSLLPKQKILGIIAVEK